MSSENNKRIARNTLMLYVRMLLMMLVSLYTSRIVLATLGVEDFGIYNVVGGIVVLFSFVNSAMSAATQRFLNFEIGRQDIVQAKRVFGMSLLIHFCISAAVLVLAETVGLWFLNTKLNIPVSRLNAANWVYQFSVATMTLFIARVPYNATIIAHERMSFFAYLGIVEGSINLGIAVLLLSTKQDKLVFYAGLLFCSSALIVLANIIYCRKTIESARGKLFYDQKLFYALLSFSGWSLFGGLANICRTQGVNMVMNIFCGVTVNAAMGIASQVNGAIFQFVSNFQMAFSPQIVKYYAAENKNEANLLVFRASKISFFLMLFFALPVIINVDFILSLWLKTVPQYTSSFVCLVLGICLVDSLNTPIYILINATGNIRNYQLIIGIFFILNVPLAYLLLSIKLNPIAVLISQIGISFFLIPVRLLIAKNNAEFPIQSYLVQVFFRVIGVFVIAVLPSFFLMRCFSGWTAFIVSSTYTWSAVVLGAWFVGLNSVERVAVIAQLRHLSLKPT
jgi:O-antigen/teichoic acid export membrane protein